MNVLIVEDEKKTAEFLKEIIENKPDYIVVNICDSIAATVSYIQKHQEKLDLIFLDIQLADGESFEIFNHIEIKVPVIFCTAYDEFVLKAFKYNGIDYILKPFKEHDIDHTLNKVHELKTSFLKKEILLNNGLKNLLSPKKTYQETFLVQFREKMVPVSVNDIAFIHLSFEIVTIYCFDGKKYPVIKTLDEIESSIDSSIFFRVNRQMIVNRYAVKEIIPYFNRKIIVTLQLPVPEKIIVSRLKVTPFKEWLENPD
ncbi:LytR/AlgR family response regulator transcription factor [Abyssalbus ytuae]|uniref:LytTR family DNA-binding domain-containing protein n=1 Tax=Abyssalbus ytuae TaxID=2926907 RepID=A0A9E7A1R3_9FLAO|nr:LytTR family DNA-binding domain-containing protein [Abyssalbus ytuae]UOB18126.1 LytTR family DNA-binding domain-containing protein [Abyssalbus ytuae]